MEAGYEVHLVAMIQPFGWNAYSSFSMYLEPNDLPKTVKMLDKAGIDIFHVHNEPDSLVKLTREGTNKPIVFDIHDLDHLRQFGNQKPSKEEIEAFELADAFIHVSEEIKDYAQEHYPSGKPHHVIYSFVNEKFQASPGELPHVCWNSICYQGGLSETEDKTVKVIRHFDEDKNQRTVFNCRYYAPMVESFLNQGYFVNMYPATPLTGTTYESLGAFVSGGPVPYPTMLRALRPHAFGFVGSCISAPLMEKAMPNKLFEYMSQGVLPVILNAKAAEEWVQAYDCGIVLDGLDNLDEQLQDVGHKRKNLLQFLGYWKMEDQIASLRVIYESVL